MSTPGDRQSAPGVEAQLQKYKEAAVNLPRLVKKYKALDSQHAQLRKQSNTSAAALDTSRKALSKAQSANEALKESLSSTQSENSVLASELEESKRENAILKGRLLARSKQAENVQPADPDSKLLAETLKEVSALRIEASSLRSALAQSRESAVFGELAAIRGQMCQLLQRWPKEDAFRATTTSRACTPVHESLASPPLQCMSSLYQQPFSGEACRACGTLVVCNPRDSGKLSAAQPNSEASAFSTQVAHVAAAPDATADASEPHPLPSPAAATKDYVLGPSVQPCSPFLSVAQAPAATQPAPHPQTSSCCNGVEGGLRSTSAAAGDMGPMIHAPALPSSARPSGSPRPAPSPESSPAAPRMATGGAQPRKRGRGIAPPGPPPRACKEAQTKKHKACGSKDPEHEGYVRVQDMAAGVQRRWKPQASAPQQKLMQFGSGTVKSTVVTGSCFSIRPRGCPAADLDSQAPGSHTSSHSKALQPTHPQPVAEVSAAVPPAAKAAPEAAVAEGSGSLQRRGAAVAWGQRTAAAHSTGSFEDPTAAHSMKPQAASLDVSGLPASARVCGDGEPAAAAQAGEGSPAQPPSAISSAAAREAAAPASVAAAEDSEGVMQSLLKAAPQLLPLVLAESHDAGTSSVPQLRASPPQLCERPAQLCTHVAAPPAASDSSSCAADVAAELAAHWQALRTADCRGEFAAEVASAIFQSASTASAPVCESAVVSALTTFSEQQSGHCAHAWCRGPTKHVHAQFSKLLGDGSHAHFHAARCAHVLQQAQTQASGSEPRICEAVAQAICSGAGAAVQGVAGPGEEGELPDQAPLWVARMHLSALVALLAVHDRHAAPSHASCMQHVMGMLMHAHDLAAASAAVMGIVCAGHDGLFSCHESIVNFWANGGATCSGRQLVRPCTLVLQVALCVTAGAARKCTHDSITPLTGEVLWRLGCATWRWRPAGLHTMRSVCGGLMELLEAAGTDAASAVWVLIRQHEQLTAALDSSCTAEPAPTSCSDTDSSSSEDSSTSDDGSHCPNAGACDSAETRAGGGGGLQRPVCAAVQDVRHALRSAAQFCGWEWTARSLLDGTVWPVFERLQKLESPVVADVCAVVAQLIEELLLVVQDQSDGDIAAAEYVATVHEALQFVS